MRPTLFRVAVALAAFLSGVVPARLLNVARLHAPATAPPAPVTATSPAAPEQRAAPAAAQPEPPKKLTPRVGQEEVMDIRGVGKVRITAQEVGETAASPTTFRDSPRLSFTDPASGKSLLDETYAGYDYDDDAQLRFKVMHVKGLPDPLIVGVAASPGGSDSGWQAMAVGAVRGKLEVLNYEDFSTNDEGGFYFGDIGGGVPGAAVWNFVWGEDESHVEAHHYEVKLYKWNPRTSRFEWYAVRRTTGKFGSDRSALRSLGFRFTDIRPGFHDFSGYELE